MTIRTFWTIFIKILGIWLVLDSLAILPQIFGTFFFPDTNGTTQSFALMVALLLIVIGVYFTILRLFVYKASWLIDKLHLDKGFADDKIDFNVQLTTVLSIATIVIGGLMFIDALPSLCREVFLLYQQKSVFRENPTSGWVIFHLVKTTLGYLMMTNSKHVVTFINKQTTKQKE